MPYRKVGADHGFRWIVDAVRLTQANPAAFMLMGLVIGVLAILPVAGSLVLAVLGPALYAGIVLAAHEQMHGRPANFAHLFGGFQLPGKLPRLVMLCLPGIVAGLLVAVLATLFLGDALTATATAPPDPDQAAAQVIAALSGPGGLLFILLMFGVGLAAYAAVFFAIPAVMLTDVNAITAIGTSLRACVANLGAFMVFVLSIIGGVMLLTLVLSLLLGWISPLLAQLAVLALLVPTFSAALLFAFRDVFGTETGQSDQVSGIEV